MASAAEAAGTAPEMAVQPQRSEQATGKRESSIPSSCALSLSISEIFDLPLTLSTPIPLCWVISFFSICYKNTALPNAMQGHFFSNVLNSTPDGTRVHVRRSKTLFQSLPIKHPRLSAKFSGANATDGYRQDKIRVYNGRTALASGEPDNQCS